MPKRIVAIIFLMLFIATSCNRSRNEAYQNSNMSYGSPKATITHEAPPEQITMGPLAYAPDVPVADKADTVDVRIDVLQKGFHVKNDVAFDAWMFGDSIPGPVLKVRVGQTIRFSMTNRADKSTGISVQMPHSIDFHAAMVNPADKYRSIDPGATIHFTWTANYPGVFMYHCGTPMVLQHMIYGMIGMVIVEPKDGFPGKVDREFSVVENEYYLKKNSDSVYVPDLQAANDIIPTYVTFNGKYQRHVNEPLHAKAGERIRMYVLNAGPSMFAGFHVIGTLFDNVWIDGNPANVEHGLQTVMLPPSGGAIVEFVLPEKGVYTFVDHSFAKANKGAIGEIIAE